MSEIGQRDIDQDFCGEALRHVLVTATPGEARPTVMFIPTVMGVSDLELGFARDLARRDYMVLVADLFGHKFRGAARDVMFGEMNRLGGDRAALRERLLAVLEVAQAQPEVDGSRLVAAGFCFGGKCALDLARTGIDLAGAAAFHGLFDPPGLPPQPIKAKVICFHGWDDPMARPEAVTALARELTEAGADWQIHAYGHTRHGFTNPNAHQIGLDAVAYEQKAARRSFAAFYDFLGEVFG